MGWPKAVPIETSPAMTPAGSCQASIFRTLAYTKATAKNNRSV